MKNRIEVYAGTAGHSVWFSSDEGQSFIHPNSHSGMYLEARAWCFSSHSKQPEFLFCGTDMGLFQWDENLTRWKVLHSPMQDVWALAQDPKNPNIIFAGSRPAELYRSMDAGLTWGKIDIVDLASFSTINMGPTRFTQILFDPIEPGMMWATVEIGGIFQSSDYGSTWNEVSNGLISIDVHGICITQMPNGIKIIYATTNQGLHRSIDNGANWEFVLLDSDWQYTRAIVTQMDDPATIWLCNGNGPPGNTGKLLKSSDYGYTWAEVKLPQSLNSTPWCIAMHESNTRLLFLCTNLGQLFKSVDKGITWERLPHEFGELRALHWRTTEYSDDRPLHSITVRRPPSAT
jgi:photosystem II stability/assembly factor-like uncharacterized protein